MKKVKSHQLLKILTIICLIFVFSSCGVIKNIYCDEDNEQEGAYSDYNSVKKENVYKSYENSEQEDTYKSINDKLSDIKFSNYYYVSKDGDDNNSGSINSPFKTVFEGMKHLNPGDCLYIREGVYSFSSSLKPNRNGDINKYIGISAYNGEKVVFNFDKNNKEEPGIRLYRSYWYISEIEIINATEVGILITGNNNILNRCLFHDNKNSGLRIRGNSKENKLPKENIIMNCDSYRNFDSKYNGENADGYGIKFNIGEGNLFYGCRAWNNADDGWDLYGTSSAVKIVNCWAFSNGIDLWNHGSTFQGNGNGFKLGGSIGGDSNDYNLADHEVYHCLSYNNHYKGFDQNNNRGNITLYNNTAYKNGQNYGFWREPVTGKNVFANNISYGMTYRKDSIVGIDDKTNRWNGINISDSDFKNINPDPLVNYRKADGALPDIDFLHLAKGSSLINSGTDVGLNYYGKSPDLGFNESIYE